MLNYQILLEQKKNSQRFNDKIAHPNTVVELEDLTPLIIELNDAIDSMNSKIKENNDIVCDRAKKNSLHVRLRYKLSRIYFI